MAEKSLDTGHFDFVVNLEWKMVINPIVEVYTLYICIYRCMYIYII